MLGAKQIANEKLENAYKLYYNNLHRFCLLRLKNQEQAEDCVQESFYILYKHYLKNEEIINVGGFLYKIADNLIKTQWRENKKAESIVQLDSIADSLADSQLMEELNDFSDIDYDNMAENLISELTEKEKELYKLKYVENKSIKEIADELNSSFDAIAKRLSRLRQKVKDIITQQFEGGDWI